MVLSPTLSQSPSPSPFSQSLTSAAAGPRCRYLIPQKYYQQYKYIYSYVKYVKLHVLNIVLFVIFEHCSIHLINTKLQICDCLYSNNYYVFPINIRKIPEYDFVLIYNYIWKINDWADRDDELDFEPPTKIARRNRAAY